MVLPRLRVFREPNITVWIWGGRLLVNFSLLLRMYAKIALKPFSIENWNFEVCTFLRLNSLELFIHRKTLGS